MFIRLLGAVGAGPDENGVIAAPGQVAAGVLAHLALASGRLLSVESLASGVWDGNPPDSARNAIQVAVSKMRKLYGPDLVEGSRTGYRLPTATVRIDWAEANRCVADARAALEADRAADALVAAEAACALFTGEPFTGVSAASAETLRHRAEELLTAGRLVRARALLSLGRADAAVELLREEVARYPLGEPAFAVLMEALAASGRPSEALTVFDHLRRRLADELGADPSQPVREVFARVLDGSAEGRPPRKPGRPAGVVQLPAVGSALLGREQELAAVTDLVIGGQRLVTLLGPGGIGKTRLAIGVAHRLAQEQGRPVVFVDLTSARGESGVSHALATATHAEGLDVTGALTGTQTLVVLDNAEHLLGAAADAVTKILAVEGVSVLVTSRTPLKLRDERQVWVDVLPAEEVDDPAVTLLADRAAMSTEQRKNCALDLRTLARRADGVPLVLELLAATLRWHTPADLLGRLDMLELSDDARDRPDRHLSVAAATDWSLREASSDARAALGALTVGRGSFSLAAASDIVTAACPGVTPAKVLAELVDLSLVQRLANPGSIRFRILEPIRLHAATSVLVAAPDERVRRAHAHHYLQAAERADDLYAETEHAGAKLLAHDGANVAEALDWAWAHEPEMAMAYLGSLLFVLVFRDRHAEVLTWSERALSSRCGSPAQRARVALARLHVLVWQQGSEESELAALAAQVRPHVDAFDDEWARRWVGCNAERSRQSGDVDRALSWLEQYPAKTPRDTIRKGLMRGHFLTYGNRWAEAASGLDDLLRLPELQEDAIEYLLALNGRGYVSLVRGELQRAEPYFDRALEICEAEGLAVFKGIVVNNQAWLALENSEFQRALLMVAKNVEDPAVQGDRGLMVEAAVTAGLALHRSGRLDEAQELARAAGAWLATTTKPLLDPYAATHLEDLRAATGAILEPAGSRIPDIASLIAHCAMTTSAGLR